MFAISMMMVMVLNPSIVMLLLIISAFLIMVPTIFASHSPMDQSVLITMMLAVSLMDPLLMKMDDAHVLESINVMMKLLHLDV